MIGGEGIDFVANALTQTWRQTYSPDKLAFRPNYFGEPAKRRGTFFYTFDQYTPGTDGGKSTLPLKIMRDLNDVAQMNSSFGYNPVPETVWPQSFVTPTGETIRLTPTMANDYMQYVEGYKKDGVKLLDLTGVSAKDYRESVDAIFTKHSTTLEKFYKTGELEIADHNAIITDLTLEKTFRHERAKKMVMESREFKELQAKASAAKAEEIRLNLMEQQ